MFFFHYSYISKEDRLLCPEQTRRLVADFLNIFFISLTYNKFFPRYVQTNYNNI